MIEIAGCAIIKDGKLLLLWKKKHSHYELPGGKIEPGETPEQAAVREANEEIVCTVQILQYGGYDDVSYQDKELRGHIFLAKIIEGEPNIMEPEIFGEMIWLPGNMLGKHKLAKNLRQFCIRYFENSDKPYLASACSAWSLAWAARRALCSSPSIIFLWPRTSLFLISTLMPGVSFLRSCLSLACNSPVSIMPMNFSASFSLATAMTVSFILFLAAFLMDVPALLLSIIMLLTLMGMPSLVSTS